MKIRMTWKDPDAIAGGVERALRREGVKEYYADSRFMTLQEEVYRAGLGEYITIEYDTETKQVTLLGDRP